MPSATSATLGTSVSTSLSSVFTLFAGTCAQRSMAKLRNEFINEIRVVVHLRHPNITTVRGGQRFQGGGRGGTHELSCVPCTPKTDQLFSVNGDELTRCGPGRLQGPASRPLSAASDVPSPPSPPLPSLQVMGACIESGREPLLVMEYLEHGSLYDLLHNRSLKMDGEIVIPMIKDIVAGEGGFRALGAWAFRF